MLTVFRTIINLGSIQLDAYTANEQDGKGNWINYLSSRGMAESIGVTDSTTRPRRFPKQFKSMLGEGFTIRQGVYKNQIGATINLSLWDMNHAAIYWTYHASQGNNKAICLVASLAGVALASGSIPLIKPIDYKHQEKLVQKRLCAAVNGEMEIPCQAGIIDILTSDQVIEVKIISGWKSALGQALAYQAEFPGHKARIHLFGKRSSKFKSMVAARAAFLGVLATFEP